MRKPASIPAAILPFPRPQAVWDPPVRFVDEQTRGPYRSWRHEHVFEPAGGGTLCRDIVDYAVLGGWLIDTLVVRRDVLKIFTFRQSKLRELFAPGGMSRLERDS